MFVLLAVLMKKAEVNAKIRTKSDCVKVGLWEEGEEEEWKIRVGDRLKEKLERARFDWLFDGEGQV